MPGSGTTKDENGLHAESPDIKHNCGVAVEKYRRGLNGGLEFRKRVSPGFLLKGKVKN